MADTVDWKKKHLDSMREMEAEERRWQGVEQGLRRLVGRLCAVGMGDDPLLDTQLDRIAKATRRAATEEELKQLFEALTQAVMTLEKSGTAAAKADTKTLKALPAAAAPTTAAAPSPSAGAPLAAVPTPAAAASIATTRTQRVLSSVVNAVSSVAAAATGTPTAATTSSRRLTAFDPGRRWQSSCDSVAIVLTRLAPHVAADELATLRSQLATAEDDLSLAGVLGRVADLISAHNADLARERSELASVLAQVTERLRDMVIVLDHANEARVRQHADSDSMNVDVLAQMSKLSDEVRASNDLTALRSLVVDRLEAVSVSVREFREREQRRFEEDSAQAAGMRARIYELENESHQLKSNLEEERRFSRIDSLTKVANRVAFDERFEEELARYRRFKNPVSVLIWDIDRFKSINDRCGHRAGDAVLREVATCLTQSSREIDFLARFGGEEFVSLLIGTPLADAVRVADQMRRSVEALKFHFHGTPVRVTISAGLTELREDDSAESVYDRADAALYKAKNGGRNTCIAA